MKVYFAIQTDLASDICECGIKISEYADRVITVRGVEIKCISAKLNPRDDRRIMDKDYTVVRLNPDDTCCYIAEGVFYEEYESALDSNEDATFWNEKYNSSVVPACEYKLGMYKSPEYLISRTMFPDVIEQFDIRRSEPILYSNSDELYIGKSVRLAEENCDDFYEIAIKAFAEKLVREQGYSAVVGKKHTVYSDQNGEVTFISKNI